MTEGFICNVCRASNGRLIYEQKLLDLNYDSNPSRLEDMEIDYWLCETCGSVTQFPLPTSELISNYYKTTLTPQTDVENYTSYKRKIHDERVSLLLDVTQLQTPGKVLEVGCANGSFLNRFDVKGFEVAGIEPSEAASKIARDHFGINVETGVIESLELAHFEDQFDLALSMHTLEHVLDPQLFVKHITKCIKPGGWLYLEVPDNSKVPGHSMLAWGDQIMAVHITHFTPQGLVLMLMKEGLSIQHVSCTGKYRYPSIQVFAKKLTVAQDGESAFMSAVDYQENLYKVAGKRLLEILADNPNTLLWGAGSDLYKVLIYTPELKQSDLKIVDINPKKTEKYFLGHKVTSPKEHKEIDMIIATPASPLLCNEIEADARKHYADVSVERLFQ